MTGLVSWATSRARMIFAFIILSIAAGANAYTSLPKEGAPNIDVPILYLSTGLPGASAADVERLIVKPLETEVRDLEGLKEMTAYATEGHSGVVLEFDFGWDKTATLADVRVRVDRAEADFPEDANDTNVVEANLSEFPILIVSVSGPAPERARRAAAKDLQRAIEALPPVLEAPLAGEREEVIEVILDPVKLDAFDVTAAELIELVQRNNRLVAAGAIDSASGSFSVSVPGSVEAAEDVYALPIRTSGDRVATLGDLAEIRRTFRDADGTARFNGQPTIALQVKKRVGENILETVAAARAEAERVRAEWPEPLREAIQVDYSLDQSVQVTSMVSQLESSVLTAVLLVMIVVVAALGLRSAVLVGLAVPCSFLLAFALLAVFGMGVSNMVMFGLILAVGMLVDGAIVVAEFAEKRLAAGAPPRQAYAEAARRMFWPIVSSTATTLCAFLPMLFWPGMPGQFMSWLPITLIFVLASSLLVALIYLPVLGGALGAASVGLGALFRRGAAQPEPERESRPLGQTRTRFGGLVRRLVGTPLGPVVAIGLALTAIMGAFSLYSEYGRGVEFFVKTEPERAIIHVRARGNLSLEARDALVREVERRVADVEGVGAVFAFAGAGGLQTEGGDAPPDGVGQLQIELTPWETRLRRDDPLTGDEVLAAVTERLSALPGGYAELALQAEGPEQGKPLQLEIRANDRAALSAATAAARARFEAEPGLIAIDDTRPLPGIEWRLDVDRTAAGRFGADVAQIGAMVQLATRGVTLDTVTPDDSDEEIDVIARFPESFRTLSALDGLMLRTREGLAPLSNFVTRTPEPKLGSIDRRDGVRFHLVRADVGPDVNANEKIAALEEWLRAESSFGAQVTARFVGDREEQAESQAFLGQAFLGALGLMFVILLAQFNSFYNAALVLSAVVMSTAGVLIGMVVMGQTFSIIMTGTGIVALAGIVVNNNIVLIDTYQEYRTRMEPLDAIARTAEDRLRPVLLTTITTIAGLMPMVFAASIDFGAREISLGAPTALWWVQLATAVVFGLAFATALTLLVTPAALALRIWIERGAFVVWTRLLGARGDSAAPQTPDSPAGPDSPAAPSDRRFGVAAE